MNKGLEESMYVQYCWSSDPFGDVVAMNAVVVVVEIFIVL